MAHDLLAPPRFTRKTQCSGVLLLVLELVSTAVFCVLYGVASSNRTTLLLNCLVAMASILSGLLGIWRSTPAAVASFMAAIGSSFGFALLGGLCLLSTANDDVEVASYFAEGLVERGVESREKLLNETDTLLEIASAVLIMNTILHLVFSWFLCRLVGERRAAIAFLQVFSLIMSPLALFLIIGGSYVVDTGTLASAPYAGLAIFSLGGLLLLVALLALIGGNFEYRRLLSICYLISALFGTCLVVLAIACLSGRTFVEGKILSNWESIRILLPPTMQSVYDRDRFAAVVRSHWNSVAYVGLLSGLFVLVEASMSLKLVHYASTWKHQVAQAKHSIKYLQQTAKRVEGTTSISHSEPSLSHFQQWINNFEKSTRRQRLAMRIIIVLLLLAVMFIFAVMCANVILVAKCDSVGRQTASTTFPLLDSNVSTNVIHLNNAYSRGELIVLPTSSTMGSVDIDYSSFRGDSVVSSNLFDKVTSNDSVSINVCPMDANQFLWLDGSCQRSIMEVGIPHDSLQRLLINSSTSVVVNASETMKVQGLRIVTGPSSVLCSNLEIQGDEFRVESTSGDLTVDRVTIDASNSSLAHRRVRVSSALGLVSVSNVTLSQCDLQVATGASPLVLSNIHSSVNMERGHIEAESSSASISVNDIHANWVTLNSETGDVKGTDMLIEGNSAFQGRLEATTVSGNIELDNLMLSGTLHIESVSGKISVQLNSQTFTGMYYMRSEYGTMSIRHTEYSSNVIEEVADSGDGLEKHGRINCDAETNNCLAYGSIYLHSNVGDIDLVLGCDSFSCV